VIYMYNVRIVRSVSSFSGTSETPREIE